MGASSYLLFNGVERLAALREESRRVAALVGAEELAEEIYRVSLEIMDRFIVNANPASLVRAVAYVLLRRMNMERRAAVLIDSDDTWLGLIETVENALSRIEGG